MRFSVSFLVIVGLLTLIQALGAVPTIDAGDTAVTVAEDQAAETPLLTNSISASDADAVDTLAWSIAATDASGVAVSGLWELAGSGNTDRNIQLAAGKALDYETSASYTVTVTVTDDAITANSVDHVVTVTVMDVNEHTPAITAGADTAVSVAEDQAAEVPLLTSPISASDADAGDILAWSIAATDASGVAVSGLWELTGEGNTDRNIQLAANQALDYETSASYTVTVTVSDGDKSVEHVVTVTVTDVNEHTPAITAGDDSVTVAEDQVAEAAVLGNAISASDADGTATLTWTIAATMPDGNGGTTAVAGLWELTGSDTDTDRNIQLAANQALDYETSASYTVTVTVSDGENSVDHVVTVTVTDVYEAATGDVGTDDTVYATDDAGGASSATDDAGASSWGAAPTDDAVGDFWSSSSDDASGAPSATDDAGTSSWGAAPTIDTGDTAVTVAEDQAAGVPLLVNAIAASDADAGDTLTWSIAATDASGSSVDGLWELTGEGNTDRNIQLAAGKTLDYETSASYTVTVIVNDHVSFVDHVVTVTVTDVNEAPVIAGVTTGSIAESAAAGTAVVGIELTATDEDADDTVTWSIKDGFGNDKFEVVTDADGKATIKVLSSLTEGLADFATSMSYTVTVVATDDDGTPLSAEQEVTIAVINPGAPVVTLTGGASTGSIAENAVATTVVTGIEMSAVDPQGDDMMWSLGADSAAVFIIVEKTDANNAGTGKYELQLWADVTLDHEDTDSYTVTVIVTDAYENAALPVTLTVSVTDVNEHAPTIDAGDDNVSVAEDQAAEVPLLTNAIAASDADGTAVLEWSITATMPDGNGGTMVVDGVWELTGEGNAGRNIQLIADTSLDYETSVSYNVTVTVSDGVNSVDHVVTVTVTDVNEYTPHIYGGRAVTVAEDQAAGTPLLTNAISASDADGTAVLTWSIAAVDAHGNHDDASAMWELAGSGNTDRNIQLAAGMSLDYETSAFYMVIVTVSDGVNAVDHVVAITVTDVNEHTPTIDAGDTAVTVEDPEHQTADSSTLQCAHRIQNIPSFLPLIGHLMVVGSSITNITVAVNETKSGLQDVSTLKSGVTAAVAEISTAVSDMDTGIQAVEDKVASLSTSMGALGTFLDSTSDNIDVTDTAIGHITTNTPTSGDKNNVVNALTDLVNGNMDNDGTDGAARTALSNALSALDTKLDNIAGDSSYASVKTNLETFNGHIATATATDGSSPISAVRDDATALATTVSNDLPAVSTISDPVADLESLTSSFDFAAVMSPLDDMANTVENFPSFDPIYTIFDQVLETFAILPCLGDVLEEIVGLNRTVMDLGDNAQALLDVEDTMNDALDTANSTISTARVTMTDAEAQMDINMTEYTGDLTTLSDDLTDALSDLDMAALEGELSSVDENKDVNTSAVVRAEALRTTMGDNEVPSETITALDGADTAHEDLRTKMDDFKTALAGCMGGSPTGGSFAACANTDLDPLVNDLKAAIAAYPDVRSELSGAGTALSAVQTSATAVNPSEMTDSMDDLSDSLSAVDIASFSSDLDGVGDSLDSFSVEDLTADLDDIISSLADVSLSEYITDMEGFNDDITEIKDDNLQTLRDGVDFIEALAQLLNHDLEDYLAELAEPRLNEILLNQGGPARLLEHITGVLDAMVQDLADASDLMNSSLALTNSTESFREALTDLYDPMAKAAGPLHTLAKLLGMDVVDPYSPTVNGVTKDVDGNDYADGGMCLSQACIDATIDTVMEGQGNAGPIEMPVGASMALNAPFVFPALLLLWGMFSCCCPMICCSKKPKWQKVPVAWYVGCTLCLTPFIFLIAGTLFGAMVVVGDVCTGALNIGHQYVSVQQELACDALSGTYDVDLGCEITVDAATNASIRFNVAGLYENLWGDCSDPTPVQGLWDGIGGVIEHMVDHMANDTVDAMGLQPPMKAVVSNAVNSVTDVVTTFVSETGEVLDCPALNDGFTSLKDGVCCHVMEPVFVLISSWYMIAFVLCCCGCPVGLCARKRFASRPWGRKYDQELAMSAGLAADAELGQLTMIDADLEAWGKDENGATPGAGPTVTPSDGSDVAQAVDATNDFEPYSSEDPANA